MLEHGGPDLGAQVTWDFSTNANPMGAMAAVTQALARVDRSSYPEPSYQALRESMARAGLGPVARLLPSAGNAEAIRRLSLAAKLAGLGAVWLPVPGYGEYRAAAQALGLKVQTYASIDDLLGRLPRSRTPALIWVCEPCNPTGAPVEAATWVALAQALTKARPAVPHQLAIDQAYAPMRLDEIGRAHV